MKSYLVIILLALSCPLFAQTNLTVDANGNLNFPKLVASSSGGQNFFTGRQVGSTYYMPSGIFRAITDNPSGINYFYDGVSGATTTFSVRSDGTGYFANSIGIGTTTPNANLEVKGASAFDSRSLFRITNNAANFGRANLVLTGRIENGNDAWSFGTEARNSIVFAQNAAASGANIGATGDEKFSIQLEGNSNSLGFLSKQNGGTPNLVMTQNGYIGIGTTTPQESLSVNGSIRSRQVKVETANWPDYIFHRNYLLKPLSEVKAFVDKNNHLPEIPSAEEVEKNGQNLGEMNKLLLKKVEELTLYLIKQKDEYEENKKIQQSKLSDLQDQIAVLQKIMK